MSESTMRGKIIKLLEPIGAFAVENPALPGTPDVNHYHGWIELKYIRSWPRKGHTIIRIDHFTTQQKRFLKKRWIGNQDAFLLVQVARFEWCLFQGNNVKPIGKEWNREEFCRHAYKHWTTTVAMERELQCVLSKRKNS